jgi:hypothetical protein
VSAEELQAIKDEMTKTFFDEKRFETMVRKLLLYAPR